MKPYNRTRLDRHDRTEKFQPGDTGWRKRDRPVKSMQAGKPRPPKAKAKAPQQMYRDWRAKIGDPLPPGRYRP